MVAWHEVPGNQQKQPPSRRDGMKPLPLGYKPEHVLRHFHR